MKAVWMLASVSALVFSTGVAHADHRDHVRGLLYRVDAEAHTLRLHPGQAGGEAQAVARQADEAADALEADGMIEEAAALKREAQALSDAARRNEPQDVRTRAIVVERLV